MRGFLGWIVWAFGEVFSESLQNTKLKLPGSSSDFMAPIVYPSVEWPSSKLAESSWEGVADLFCCLGDF